MKKSVECGVQSSECGMDKGFNNLKEKTKQFTLIVIRSVPVAAIKSAPYRKNRS